MNSANPRHLRDRNLILREFVLFCRDVVLDRVGEFFWRLRPAVVRDREFDAEEQRQRAVFNPPERRLRVVHLFGGERGRDFVEATRRELRRLDVERRFFRRGFFLRFEIAANPEAIEATIDPPRDDAIPVFEPVYRERGLIHD